MLPPIQVLVGLFRNLKPVMESMGQMKGKQTFAKPEVVEKEIEGKKHWVVVEKTIFDVEDDVKHYVDVANRFHAMKF